MTAKTPQSRKAKGRLHQQAVAAAIRKFFPFLSEDDVVSRGMGGQGEDIILSRAAREVLPISIECKSVEKLNVWQSWEQAQSNTKGWNPVLIFKRSRSKPLVICELDYFLSLHSDCDRLAKIVQGVK